MWKYAKYSPQSIDFSNKIFQFNINLIVPQQSIYIEMFSLCITYDTTKINQHQLENFYFYIVWPLYYSISSGQKH